MLPKELVEDNPWWGDPSKVDSDPLLVRRSGSSAKWEPEIMREFDFGGDFVYSLRGPRRIGKTTAVKALIRELVRGGASPWNVMYRSFCAKDGPKELVSLVKCYLDNTADNRGKDRRYLFLEISSVRDWQKGVKRLWDQKRLDNCTVIVIGSLAADPRRSAERLPGRRGELADVDKAMLPMKFSEFASVMDQEIARIVEKNFRRPAQRKEIFERYVFNNRVPPVLHDILARAPALDRHLEDYMLTGGVPKAISEYRESKAVAESTYADHLGAIREDFGAFCRREGALRQVAERLCGAAGMTTSWGSLRKGTDVRTEYTASRYVGALEDMFVVSVLYQYDLARKGAIGRKKKKIHFQDPFYFSVLNGWISGTPSFEAWRGFVEQPHNQGRLVEGIVANHLIRLAFLRSRKKRTFVGSNHVHYWRNGGSEVDLVYNDGAGVELPVDVKFQPGINNRDLDGLINFKRAARGRSALMVTQGDLSEHRECTMIPASMFLLMV